MHMLNWKTLQEYWNSDGTDMEPDTAVSVKVVAVVGYGNDWAAYWGPDTWTNI